MPPSEKSDDKQILLIGELLYATAAWDALSALGQLRVRVSGSMKREKGPRLGSLVPRPRVQPPNSPKSGTY